jgi:hypothetical protein
MQVKYIVHRVSPTEVAKIAKLEDDTEITVQVPYLEVELRPAAQDGTSSLSFVVAKGDEAEAAKYVLGAEVVADFAVA